MADRKGKVYLVGAGPGDEELLTVKAVDIIKRADVIVYDRLVSGSILSRIPDNAEKINVGKNAGNHPVPQHEINKILINKALEGKTVVRLKGGDPFVFGRGGEELEFLHENGIPFEVVPGITSAIAAAAYAGIPVTHRDFCSSLHIITGHAKDGGSLDIDYDSLVKLKGTLIFLMSVASFPQIALGLIEAGLNPDMDAAVIENGTRANQRKFVAKLCDIPKVIEENQVQSPAIIVVGKVCALSGKLDWFSKLPLYGCNVLVTGPKKTSEKLVGQLSRLGAYVIEYPCIDTEPMDFDIDIKEYSWIIFTSSLGVQIFFKKLNEAKLDSRHLHNKKIAAVGSQTAEELLKHGICADFVPSKFDGKHLANELLRSGKITSKDKVVVFRAKDGTKELVEIFESSNISYTDVPAYTTKYIKQDKVDINNIDYITFTSESCVKGFAYSFDNAINSSKINAICIGEQTAKAARAYGMNTIISDAATVSSMVEKIVEIYCVK
ncbi:MAG TPA: uroporphyrinogen-III C-methyltransferase [Acetivibrio sp.]|uniref:uroporphyrinogen-III C-methyltransferase n=1 Tax=Acetivibrio sp. TaxID=1872092 RepID=UPI002CB71F86|nr:uroporphyrinogen-III C-methyltransferase [Acetivibrio sp.]HOM01600.1 uroporphyrinogen-III C-methyltransferase [Acetivibrio sp.]